MALIPPQKPLVNFPASHGGSPSVLNLSVVSGQTVLDGDILALSSGQIQDAGVNASGSLAGIAQHDGASVFNQLVATEQGVFGTTQVGTLLTPSPGQVIVATLGSPATVEINLTAVTGWVSGGTYQVNIGSRVGLNKDGTTGYYLADPNASNKVATIVYKPNSGNPGAAGVGDGGIGDLGARVGIVFDSSALAIQQGH